MTAAHEASDGCRARQNGRGNRFGGARSSGSRGGRGAADRRAESRSTTATSKGTGKGAGNGAGPSNLIIRSEPSYERSSRARDGDSEAAPAAKRAATEGGDAMAE